MSTRLPATIVGILLLLIAAKAWAAPEVPGRPQERPIALVGGTIHTANGLEIQRGVILFDDGKIVELGRDVPVPAHAERIDVSGYHVYPGLIDACTSIGLVEIPSVRATVDERETGQINPNVRAQVAVNPDSELIPVTRAGGVLTVLTSPSGGIISGTSALIHLDGWTWEDMTLKAPIGMHIDWPRMAPLRAWWVEDSAQQQLESRDRALKQIQEAFDDARAYWKAKQAEASSPAGGAVAFDARWEAMIPVLEGTLPVIIAADEIRQIQAAVAFAQREGIKLIILGGYDAPLCAELLKEHNVPVIVHGVNRLPQNRSDDYDTAFTLPERLRQAGVPFCISGNDRTANVRNLPYHAAAAAAHGLPKEEALKAVTIYPAQIFGVADRLGSLESGKDATLIVTSGDPLEITTQIEAAFIEGRRVQLTNRQQRLWEKYREKYRRQGLVD